MHVSSQRRLCMSTLLSFSLSCSTFYIQQQTTCVTRETTGSNTAMSHTRIQYISFFPLSPHRSQGVTMCVQPELRASDANITNIIPFAALWARTRLLLSLHTFKCASMVMNINTPLCEEMGLNSGI